HALSELRMNDAHAHRTRPASGPTRGRCRRTCVAPRRRTRGLPGLRLLDLQALAWNLGDEARDPATRSVPAPAIVRVEEMHFLPRPRDGDVEKAALLFELGRIVERRG